MASYHVVVLPGDGVGPEIIREGMKVIRAAMGLASLDVHFTELTERLRPYSPKAGSGHRIWEEKTRLPGWAKPSSGKWKMGEKSLPNSRPRGRTTT